MKFDAVSVVVMIAVGGLLMYVLNPWADDSSSAEKMQAREVPQTLKNATKSADKRPRLLNLSFSNPPVTRKEGPAASHIKSFDKVDSSNGPIMAHDRSEAVYIGDVFKDWQKARTNTNIQGAQLMDYVEGCALSKPDPRAMVVNIEMDEASNRPGIYAYDMEDLGAAAAIYIRRLQSSKNTKVQPAEKKFGFFMSDIAITETVKPVHLVLHSAGFEIAKEPFAYNTLANIHLGHGAVVSGITLLGGDAMGVANVASDIPVEVMSRAQLLKCGLESRSLRRLKWLVKVEARDKDIEDEDKVVALVHMAENKAYRFNAWFEDIFGAGTAETRLGYHSGYGTLIGPIPITEQQRLAYTPLSASTPRIAAKHFLKFKGIDDWPASYHAEVIEMTRKLAGGDLDALRPQATMVRGE